MYQLCACISVIYDYFPRSAHMQNFCLRTLHSVKTLSSNEILYILDGSLPLFLVVPKTSLLLLLLH